MSMIKSLFRPGAGARIEQYTSAFVMEAVYPGSWVCVNTEVPTAQGASGVLDGQTLGVLDYVECELIAEDVLGAEACFLGCVRGASIDAVNDWTDVSGDVLANNDLAIIQSWGVHPGGWIVDVGALGDFIGVHATNEGEGDPSSTMSADGYDMGAQLRLGTSVTMGDAQHNAIVWVRRM
jgi:hypothetical protein